MLRWCIAIFLCFSAALAQAESSVYSVQVMTASLYDDALNMYGKLEDFPDIRIEKINNAYVVRTGSFQSRAEAIPLLRKVQRIQPDALVRNCYIDAARLLKMSNPSSPVKSRQPAGEEGKSERVKEAKQPSPKPSVPAMESLATKPSEAAKPLATPTREKAEERTAPDRTAPISPAKPDPQAMAASPAVQADAAVDVYFQSGMKNHTDRHYEDAIGDLSHFLSLNPTSEQAAAALLIIGKSFENLNRLKSALLIYSRIIRTYPESTEALLSTVAIADIGLSNPELKLSPSLTGADSFRDPLTAYNTVLLKPIPTATAEHVLFQKGRTLWKQEKYPESAEVLGGFLNQFPSSLYRKDALAILKNGTAAMIDRAYQAGDDLTVAHLFVEGRKDGAIAIDDIDIIIKSSLSLAHLGLYDLSLNIIAASKKNCPSPRLAELDQTIAEIGKLKDSRPENEHRISGTWDLFDAGRAYLSANNLTQAEQTLSDLKSKSGDPFWSKLSDYALEDSKWMQKYHMRLGRP